MDPISLIDSNINPYELVDFNGVIEPACKKIKIWLSENTTIPDCFNLPLEDGTLIGVLLGHDQCNKCENKCSETVLPVTLSNPHPLQTQDYFVNKIEEAGCRAALARLLHTLQREMKNNAPMLLSLAIYLIDKGHGLRHGLHSLAYTIELRNADGVNAQKHADLSPEELLAVFHDFSSHLGRGNHTANSGEILKKYCGTPAQSTQAAEVAAFLMKYAGRRHSVIMPLKDDTIDEKDKEIFQREFHSNSQEVQDIIDRHFDADRLDETIDLERLVYVNRCAGRTFFDPYMRLSDRFAVCDELNGRVIRRVCGVRGTDTLTILLYSLTRNLKESSYRTQKAKDLISKYKESLRNSLGEQLKYIINTGSGIGQERASRAIFVTEAVLDRYPVS